MQLLFRHLATYNQWMNRKLYNAAAVLSDEQLTQDRGAFFGSIWATLNHIAVGDILWLRRVAGGFPHLAALAPVQDLPQPSALTDILCPDVAALTQLRATIDEVLTLLCAELSEHDLNAPLQYHSTKGVRSNKLLSEVLLHVFNHQTHHRGQITTLYSQMGIDVGGTDFITVIPNQA